MVQFCGCNTQTEKDPFEYLYTRKLNPKLITEKLQDQNDLYSFSADSMPFSIFIRWLSDRSNFGFVYQNGLENKKISAEVQSATIEEIVDTISRSHNLKFLKIGNTYYIGDLRKEDRGFLVKRVLSVEKEFLKQSVDSILSETGKCSVSENCLLVVSDFSTVLSRISDMCDQLQDSSPGTWILQFFITMQKKQININAGADFNSSGSIAYALTKEQGDSNFSSSDSTNITNNIELILNNKSEYIDVISAPMMLIRDGSSGEWYDGVTTPIPEYTVSSYGVRTVSGYKDYKTGFSLKSSIRETPEGCILQCKYESSNITGYTDMWNHISITSDVT